MYGQQEMERKEVGSASNIPTNAFPLWRINPSLTTPSLFLMWSTCIQIGIQCVWCEAYLPMVVINNRHQVLKLETANIFVTLFLVLLLLLLCETCFNGIGVKPLVKRQVSRFLWSILTNRDILRYIMYTNYCVLIKLAGGAAALSLLVWWRW